MSTVTFDTLKFAERLEKAGLTREQASAIAEAHKDVLAEALDSTLATKADISTVRTELRSDISRLENKMEYMELRMTVKLGAFIAASAAIIITVLKIH